VGAQRLDFRERYEVSTDPQAYFDESGPAMQRLSKDVARSVVSTILEHFLDGGHKPHQERGVSGGAKRIDGLESEGRLLA